MSTQHEPRDLDDVEEEMDRIAVIQDSAALDRAMRWLGQINAKKKALTAWYCEEIARLEERAARIESVVATYAVAFRERAKMARPPVRFGSINVTQQQVVDLSDKAAVKAWFLAARAAGDTAIPTKPPGPVELDYPGLKDWVKWAEDGSCATDPREGHEGEIIPGLKRGRPQPWHVSIETEGGE